MHGLLGLPKGSRVAPRWLKVRSSSKGWSSQGPGPLQIGESLRTMGLSPGAFQREAPGAAPGPYKAPIPQAANLG